jgi:hypothetical protein
MHETNSQFTKRTAKTADHNFSRTSEEECIIFFGTTWIRDMSATPYFSNRAKNDFHWAFAFEWDMPAVWAVG